MKRHWELIAGIVHELRTPLNGLIGWIRLVLDGAFDDLEERNDFLREAYRMALHSQDMMNDFRRYEEPIVAAGGDETDFYLISQVLSELEEPFQGISHRLQLILDDRLETPDKQQESLHDIYALALHLLAVITALLEIAWLETGHVLIQPNPVRVNELLADIKKWVQPQVEQQQLYFRVQYSPTSGDVILFTEQKQLRHVIFMLLHNAIQYTPQGGVTVAIEVLPHPTIFRHQQLPGMAQIQIRDTGIGVSPEEQARLFQPFSRSRRASGGTGLGLVLAARKVAALGGTIHFDSKGEGQGSTVTVTVPLHAWPHTPGVS